MTIIMRDKQGEYSVINAVCIFKNWNCTHGECWTIIFDDDTEEHFPLSENELLEVTME